MEAETKIDDDGVFDPIGEEPTRSEVFSITSYGADYPLEIIPKRISSKDWYAPTFQRNFIWSLNQASRFIESLLLGLPVPGIFLFKESETGKHLIIDGQQRTKSIQLYLDGDDFRGRKFRLQNVIEKFEGRSFNELDEDDQRRLNDAIIHATIFQQKSPEDDISSVYEVFERINTGGSKLSAQEIRSCVSHGAVVEFLEELSQGVNWTTVFKSSSARLKDHELILRFYSFYYNLEDYTSPMNKFLDAYMGKIRNINNGQKVKYRQLFEHTLRHIVSSIGERAFRPERAFNAAVFDSVTVATAKAITENNLPNNYQEKYDELLSNPEFLELTSRSTAVEDRVKARFRIAKETLSNNA